MSEKGDAIPKSAMCTREKGSYSIFNINTLDRAAGTLKKDTERLSTRDGWVFCERDWKVNAHKLM